MAQSFEEALPGLQAAGYGNIMDALAAYNAANQAAYFSANQPTPALSAPLSMPIFGPPAPGEAEPSRVDQVSAFIQNNLDNPQVIADAARQFNVSPQEIQQTIGLSPQEQADYFARTTAAPSAQTFSLTPVPSVTGEPIEQEDLLLESRVIPTEPVGFLPVSSAGKAVSPLDYGKMVASAYSNILNRQADTGGMEWWVSQLESGKISPQEFEAVFRDVAKPELDVKALYEDVLKRQADVGGLSHWTKEIGAGGITPEERERFIQEAINAGELKAPAPPAAVQSPIDKTLAEIGATKASMNPDTYNFWSQKFAEDPENARTTFLTYVQNSPSLVGGKIESVNAAWRALNQVPADVLRAGSKEYDKGVLLNLTQQIVPNISSFSGGVFGETRPSIGFSYEEARNLLNKDPTVGEQVVLDMAKSLMDQGITDLSQLKVKDVIQDVRVIPIEGGFAKFTGSDESGQWTPLTPEEAKRVQAIGDNEGGFSYIAKDINTGLGLYAGDKLLTQSTVSGQPLEYSFGRTFSGPGLTGYHVIADPQTGKYKFATFADDTGEKDLISFGLTVASFVPGLAPFAQATNAYLALKNGDTLGALASLSGMTEFSNVTTALNVANAVDKGNLAAAASAIMSNPAIANAAGSTMLTETISLKDVGTAFNLATAAANGNIGGMLVNAGTLANSADLQLAGQALTLIDAAQSGNISLALATVKNIQNTAATVSQNLNNQSTVSNLISNITQGEIEKTGEETLSEAIYTAAIKSGATEQEALDAANAITKINATSGGDTTKVSSTGDLDADVMSGVTKVDLGEFEGFDDAIKATTERNTLTIGNTQADTLEEAAALAANRGFTNFTFGGNTYSISNTSSDLIKNITNAEIAAATNFSDAYSIARNALGAGQIFEWNGKQYSTDSREENPSLAAASDQIRLAQSGVGGGKGTYAGYDTDAVGKNLSQIDLSALDQAQTYGTFDPFLKSAGVGGDYVIVDDKISKQIIDPVVKTAGLVTRGVGGAAESFAGFLQGINVIDKNSPLIQFAKDAKEYGEARIGDHLLNEEKQLVQEISDAKGAWETTKALINGVINHPTALVTMSISEGVEETPTILGGIVSVITRAPMILAYGQSALINLIDAFGSSYNDAKQQALNAGKSEAEAHKIGQQSGGAAGALAFVLGPLVEVPLIKRAGELIEGTAKTGIKEGAKEVGKTVGKEVVTESFEGGGTAAVNSFLATGKVDMNQVVTSAILDPLVAGHVTGTVATVVEVAGNKPATTEVVAAATTNPDQAANLINTINATMQPGVDLKQAGADIVTAMTASGMNTQQAESVANTAIAEQILTNINSYGNLNIPDVNVAVGADKFGNAITLGDFLGSSVTGTGNIAFVAPDIYIGTNAQGQPITVGDLSSLNQIAKNTGTKTTTTDESGGKTTTEVDQNTGATTETTTNTNTGVNTSVTTNENTGVTTEVTTDTNTNTNTEVKTDTNNNTQTTTTTDTNTNTTTQTTVDSNTNTTTTINTNSNNQITSEVVVDNNNNTETTTETNVDTNTQTTTVIDTNTNTVISQTTAPVTTIPTLDPVAPVEPAPETEEEKEKNKKKQKARKRLTQGAVGGAGMSGELTGLDAQMLKSYVTGEKKIDPLKRLREIQQESEAEAMIQNIDPRLASVLQERMGVRPQEDLSGLGTLARVLTGNTFDMEKAKQAEKDAYYTYGKEDSIDDILGTTQMQGLPYAAGGYVEPLMAQGGMTLPLMAKKGGLPQTVEGREDFRHGKHVAGEGDGQSDDIPAMLADGEFVFPADVVSALGNGSSKAGTDKLYEMMHAIRERARSTKNKDLPPPALKSPLDYLKSKR